MRIFKLSVLFLLMFFLARPAVSLDAWRLVVRLQGRVASKQVGQGDFSPIFRARVLNDGDMAKTFEDSRAKIQLADQSEFLIGQNSVVEMTKFQLTPGGRVVLFTLQAGKVRAKVAKLVGGQSKFEVQTPNGVLSARGTEFFAEICETPTGKGLCFIVFSGLVGLTTPNGQVHSFGPGTGGMVTPGGQVIDKAPIPGGPDADLMQSSVGTNTTTPPDPVYHGPGGPNGLNNFGDNTLGAPPLQPPSTTGGGTTGSGGTTGGTTGGTVTTTTTGGTTSSGSINITIH